MKKNEQVKTDEDLQKQIDELPTTSSKIRFLDSKNYSRSKISKTLGIRYQHVRNVLITPVTKPKTK